MNTCLNEGDKFNHLKNFHTLLKYFSPARVAELVDALDSGSSDRKVAEVRVLFRASSHQILSKVRLTIY